MKIKTADLTDAALDWAVLEALKADMKDPSQAYIGTFGPLFGKGYRYPAWKSRKYSPSTDWAQGGPIIEREEIGLNAENGEWYADCYNPRDIVHCQCYGPTPLVAAMRCFVASRLGDEVDVPDELIV